MLGMFQAAFELNYAVVCVFKTPPKDEMVTAAYSPDLNALSEPRVV